MNELESNCVVGKCMSVEHGSQLAAVATMRTEEPLLAAYMRWLCSSCGRVSDSYGRTALHMAATCGHGAVVRWLIRHANAVIDAADLESGYTPLHRSIFYGQIHVAADLMKMGANVNVLDHEGLSPIDHAMKDRPAIVEFNTHNLCEVYVWGSNTNYTLGTGIEHSRPQPELLDFFRKQKISIKQVALHKFHSVFVSHDGRVFSCGHGQGGRLGLGSSAAVLTPSLMQFQTSGNSSPDGSSVSCSTVSLGLDHTVLLMENGSIWTCGLNAYHQLGHSPAPSSLLSPRQLTPRSIQAAGESVVGVCAARYHTVLWSPKAVLTFGLHGGQLGHSKSSPTIMLPRQVTSLPHKSWQVITVATSDSAIVIALMRVANEGGTNKVAGTDIYLLHKFECRKIIKGLVGVKQLVVVGGHLDSAKLNEDNQGNTEEENKLQVFVLVNEGHLFLWQENATFQLSRCLFSVNRPIMVTDFTVQTNGQLLLVTRDGEAFEGQLKLKGKRPGLDHIMPRSKHDSYEGDLKVHYSGLISVQVRRLPHIHRAVSITSEPKGRNFAVIQTHPLASLLEVPQVETSDLKQELSNFLQEAYEEDSIHDVVFQVGNSRFPAHLYVITSRCEVLANLVSEHRNGINGNIPTVELKNIRADVFRQILQFIYTNDCTIMHPGECPIQVSQEECAEKKDINISCEVGDILESPDKNNISAFEVFGKRNKQHNKNNKLSNNKSKFLNNPVRLVQVAATRFKLTDLNQELEKIRFEDGHIEIKHTGQPSFLKPLSFKRGDCEHLYDVKIRSEDGKEFQAHKCILIARLDYFRSMLSGRWVETHGKSGCVLNLPLPHIILEVLLNFLYTDCAPTVASSEDLDFLRNMLVMADQLFVTRLRETTEVALANILTLRNIGQVLQLSGTYNAEQLKQCCFQYITLNLPAILELRILESVDRNLLEDLTKYYVGFIPSMNQRIVTPYSTAPNYEFLTDISNCNPIPAWDEDDSSFNEDDIYQLKKKIKMLKKRSSTRKSNTGESKRRSRNESVGSNNSWSDDIPDNQCDLDLNELIEKENIDSLPEQKENDITLSLSNLLLSTSPDTNLSYDPPEDTSPWSKVLNNHDKQHKILARLQAIKKAESIAMEPKSLSFSKLIPKSRQLEGRNMEPSSPINVVMTAADFPELQKFSPPSPHDHRSSGHKHSDHQKIAKLSQKQWKKLASELDMSSHENPRKNCMPAWSISSCEKPSDGSFSLLDIMKQEMQMTRGVQPHQQDLISPGTSPVAANPWLRGTENVSKSPHQQIEEVSSPNFSDIVADEKKQKENWIRMRAKPLQLTQLEDQAIEDLLVFYNAAGAADECITVKRVIIGNIPPPTWITTHH